MQRIALVSILGLLGLLCSCGTNYNCDVYYYGAFGYEYQYSEDYYGTSASNAEENCDNSYSNYYDCRDCQ